MRKIYFFILIVFFFAGCASVQEPFKAVWGSSTKALEDYRGTATIKDFKCSSGDCFDAIVKAIKVQEKKEIKGEDTLHGTTEMIEVAGYEIFIQDKKKGLIVVMGVPKSETTTEVGIFVTGVTSDETKIEVVSLSSAAQKIASDHIFTELSKVYPVVFK